MRVEVWSDVVCPWCYVGKRNFEAALGRFEHRDHVEVTWRSFELDPSAPAVREGDYATRLAGKYGMTLPQAQKMIETMTATAACAGLVLDFGKARPGNTFDAHRLLHLARERGCQAAVKERLLRATFTEGEAIGDHEVLLRLGLEAGLPAEEAATVLAGDAYAADVRADEELALDLGISAVPFFVIDRTFGVPGAQAPDVLLRALQRAWDKAPSD
jgi:predicted DsbA family dithiol-disulfide isomerase